jgi:hypothetical protein
VRVSLAWVVDIPHLEQRQSCIRLTWVEEECARSWLSREELPERQKQSYETQDDKHHQWWE